MLGDGRHRTKGVAQWGMLATMSPLGVLAAYGSGNGRWQLVAVAMGGSLLCLAAYLRIGRMLPQYYTMRLLIVSYALQLMVLAAVAALGQPLSPPLHPFEVNAADAPFRVALAILTVPAGTLIAALAWWFVTRSSRLVQKPGSLGDTARSRRVYLVIAAFVQLLYWPASLETAGIAGYLVRIVASALTVAPFLAGRDSRDDRRLAGLWCLVILANGVVGIVTGSRSKGLIAVVLFAAGYISALPRSRRLVAGGCAVLATIPLIQFSGAVGIVRGQTGRGGLELVSSDHIRDVFRELSREMAPWNRQNVDEVNLQGLSRMIAWTNVVVPLLTPEAIPYRGLDGFLAEARQSFRIASVSGQTVDDLLDAGLSNEPATRYGFTVSAFTAVEFTVGADAWSRGGAPVALLFSFILALAMTIGELCAYRLHRYGTGVATILALPIARAAFFDASVYPLLPTLRGMFLNLLAIATVVVVLETARLVSRQPSRHGPSPRRMASAPHSGVARTLKTCRDDFQHQ